MKCFLCRDSLSFCPTSNGFLETGQQVCTNTLYKIISVTLPNHDSSGVSQILDHTYSVMFSKVKNTPREISNFTNRDLTRKTQTGTSNNQLANHSDFGNFVNFKRTGKENLVMERQRQNALLSERTVLDQNWRQTPWRSQGQGSGRHQDDSHPAVAEKHQQRTHQTQDPGRDYLPTTHHDDLA